MPKVGQQWPNAFVMDLPTLNGSSIEDFVMATFSVSLPDRMKEYIDAQVKGGDFVDSGDFLREFVRRDQGRRIEELRQILEDATASGISTMTTDGGLAWTGRAPA
jgi:antitoxin ParD1/3/4